MSREFELLLHRILGFIEAEGSYSPMAEELADALREYLMGKRFAELYRQKDIERRTAEPCESCTIQFDDENITYTGGRK